MHRTLIWSAVFLIIASVACANSVSAQNKAADASAAPTATDLSTGWSLLKEGEAEATFESDAKYPKRDSPHLIRIAVTKTAAPKKGRAGATNSVPIPVQSGESYEVTFAAVTDSKSIGLVFSLESADGKVLARTTLPEIGSGRPGSEAEGGGARATTMFVFMCVARIQRLI